ncbi:MAG: SUMF1/EgtB/PvdO family nonheme iron enzyme [Gammaproteobacteria bacterium]|nr:SUMF1/EgtB/PvdO family nonheme iron enzyme [Gammaproteobacteria bacterium]
MSILNWLHLTDLHQGMEGGSHLWPNVEAEFFKDLKAFHNTCGPWDLILFSGDLTQNGDPEEFSRFNETLERLYKHLRKLGSDPVLLAVPGNHDQQRPDDPNKSDVVVLRDWSNHPEIQKKFWKDAECSYRKTVDESFAPYMAWQADHPFPKPNQYKPGCIPGDFSATIEKNGFKLGVIGLNSTFLQLGGGNRAGKLALDIPQLSAVCGKHYNDWFEQHHLCLLMTHHPVNWLAPAAKKTLEGEIAPAGRFALHLYGHMHGETLSRDEILGGAAAKRYWQGASLFGMKNWGGPEELDRRHGYTAMRLSREGETCNLEYWPRKAQQAQAGPWEIKADTSFSLNKIQQNIVAKGIPLRKFPDAPQPSLPTASPESEPPPFKILLLATDKDLAEYRETTAQYLNTALGVETAQAAAETGIDPAGFDLCILLQAWWWDQRRVANIWLKADESKRIVFLCDEEAEWPPRKLSERAAQEDIEKFRAQLDKPHFFDDPNKLPEKVGEAVTPIMQQHRGSERSGLHDWERNYLRFRLSAWRSGRSAGGQVHSLQTEGAEELYRPDFYVPLDGVSSRWQKDEAGNPEPLEKKADSGKADLAETAEKRISLSQWVFSPHLPHLTIVGVPGSGKTVFLTRIAAALGNACLGRPTTWESGYTHLRQTTGLLPIPVLLEATRIAKHPLDNADAIVQALRDELNASGSVSPEVEVRKGLEQGRYLLLIDALDEIPEADKRTNVLDLLKGFKAGRFQAARLVLTTRSARYTGSLAFGPELEVIELASMNEPQVKALCSNRTRCHKRDADYLHALLSAVTGLAEQVGTEEQPLTQNPLMLTAICMVFERYQSLPDDRARLCDLLIDDLCRSRRSVDDDHDWKLDDAAKKDLLQRIALGMQEQGTQTWPTGRAINTVMEMVPAAEKLRNQRAAKYLHWAADHTGLLRFQQPEQGEEEVRFWHRLFREYLVASRLAQLDITVDKLIDKLWAEQRLLDPFWEDVIRLLPRALGTLEKAGSLYARLKALAEEHAESRGRLLGLAAAAIIESRDLFPKIDVVQMAQKMADIYAAEGESWSFGDRYLFLDGLGRLAPTGDPRLHEERWVRFEGGQAPSGKKKFIEVEPFSIAWAPVTVQEYKVFVDAEDRLEPRWWENTPEENRLMVSDAMPGDWWRKQLRYPNRPVMNVSWYEAMAYCRWRTARREDGCAMEIPSWAEQFIARQLYGSAKFYWEDEEAHKIPGQLSSKNYGHLLPTGMLASDEVSVKVDLNVDYVEWCCDYDGRQVTNVMDLYRVGINPKEINMPGGFPGDMRHSRFGFRCVLRTP